MQRPIPGLGVVLQVVITAVVAVISLRISCVAGVAIAAEEAVEVIVKLRRDATKQEFVVMAFVFMIARISGIRHDLVPFGTLIIAGQRQHRFVDFFINGGAVLLVAI
ncbi:Uncharacterised protein [Yokenella regensburgei]|nr:Uncharacterised protein [Yokenella regensburgei]